MTDADASRKQGSQRRPRRRRTVSKKRLRAAPSLLILECDPERLPAQPASFAAELESLVKAFVPCARSVRVQAKVTSQLLADLARLKSEFENFKMVIVVAHSNAAEVMLAADASTSWEGLGRWLAPFSPRIVLLVACEAGRWVASQGLFENIASLKEVYGSPVLINDLQAAGIKILVPYLLSGRRLRREHLRAGQVLNFLLTRGIVLRRTRRDFREPGVLEGLAWTAGEELLKAALRRQLDVV
jgi:hypothetical protein